MLTRKEEDYLEVIYTLSNEKGYARIKDISKTLEVRPPTAVGMVQKLSEKGFIDYIKNEPVTLTKKGIELAKIVKTKHKTFRDFFKILLVPELVAKKDSLKIEHNLNPFTIEQLTKFINFLETRKEYSKFSKDFKDFCKGD
jgi:DtxR family Mn-dependent transcriptional regulator